MCDFSVSCLGVVDYEQALSLQRELVALRASGGVGDVLLLLEHEPVLTLGASGGESSLLAPREEIERAGVAICRTDRGGNVTYHGPGQLVGYPIFDLHSRGKDVHLFLRNIEQAIVLALSEFGIRGVTVPDYTGVWVDGDKICSIGIAVRKWITYHGFALNVSPNYDHWRLIHPCGLVDKQVTSIERLTGRNPGMDVVQSAIIFGFAQVFAGEPLDQESVPEVRSRR